MAQRRQRGGREAEYRALMVEQARSGLSIREFAEGQGILAQTFYWWRGELRRRDRARGEDTTDFVRVSVLLGWLVRSLEEDDPFVDDNKLLAEWP